jgi:uncharacterized protein YyaL (SSP411 family)
MSSDVPAALRRNRLDDEASPYLQQHADNPVNWQPWDTTALEAARELDRPIFLSVGYSACHWCHVMEEESFADERVARVLNDSFVPVKVDREERPDVDSVYMTVAQLVTGGGGWPLSAWLTPDGEPFYVGTYFPPESRGGRPGFGELCERIAGSWTDPENRAEMEDRARKWAAAARDELEGTPEPVEEPPDTELLDGAASAALRAADRRYGGFGSGGPKFPNPGRLHLLLRAHDRTGRDEYGAVARETLDAMAEGGLYDHLGGGFHRYATDRSWTVPHFEKMLYDQATLVRAYVAGWQAFDEDRYEDVVRESLAFVERELTHPEGGFFSTLDAQSATDTGDQAEGAFYVWTPETVRTAVGEDADLFADRYGVTGTGNFENGQTVLTLDRSISALAEADDVAVSTVEERLDRAKRAAFEARADRPRPARDEKVLAGWNGLMISAFAEAAVAMDPSFTEPAVSALAFCRDRLWDAEAGRLARRYRDGDVLRVGYLEDYAALGRGAFDCYQATGDVEHLSFALELATVIEREFWDGDERTLYFTPRDAEALVARPQETDDASTPAASGVAASLLLDLSLFVDHDRFRTVAEGVIDAHARSLESDPLSHATMLLAADDRAAGPLELTVAADALPETWRERLGRTYLPGRVLSVRPPTEAGLGSWLERLGLGSAPPVWAGREARGEPTLYTCRSFTCSPPVHDPEAALEWAADLAP